MVVSTSPKSCHLFDIVPVEVCEVVSLPGESKQGIGTQPDISVHAWSEVESEEWEFGIGNL